MSTQTPPPGSGPEGYYSPPAPRPSRPFFRPAAGRMLGGVCAAIADYFGWERTVVRLIVVASIFLPGPQVLAYLVLWLIVPSEERYWQRRTAGSGSQPAYPQQDPTQYPTTPPPAVVPPGRHPTRP